MRESATAICLPCRSATQRVMARSGHVPPSGEPAYGAKPREKSSS